MEVLQQRVYTNNMPRLTPSMERKATRALGRSLPEEIDATKDGIPADVAVSMRQMQEQLTRVLNIVDSVKADNERLKTENEKLRASTSLANRGTEPTQASMKPNPGVQIPVPPAPEAVEVPAVRPKRGSKASSVVESVPAPDPDPAIPTPEQ